jgi:hypothetical protein
MDIPKIIHQTARSSEFPPLIEKCVASLRRTNPDWDYRFYTDEDWSELITPRSVLDWDHFMRYPSGIQKADLFRCAVLYERGGLYADVDMLGIRSAQSLIDHACEGGIVPPDTELILTTDHPIHSRLFFGRKEIYMNNFMLAKPGARFLKIYLEEMKSAVASSPVDTGWPLSTTGPPEITRLIHQHGGLDALKIAVVPYFWINPLPDMAMDFKERPIYRKMIDDGSWRRAICPYFVHCWWHSYVSGDTEGHYRALWQNEPSCSSSQGATGSISMESIPA